MTLDLVLTFRWFDEMTAGRKDVEYGGGDMMYCLHCGDCCRRMSPLSAPKPCPHLIERGSFVFCGIYDRRPEECRKHDFPARVCPVGASMLDLPTTDALRKRIDDGFQWCSNDQAQVSSEAR